MKKLMNLLRGYVELEVTGAFPERLLNLCAQQRLQFWRLQWLDGTSFQFRIALQDLARLEELASRTMCELEIKERRGAAAVAVTMRKRWGFLAGLVLCLVAVSFLSRFLLVVEVVGNETVPTAVILTELQRLGVRPGAYGPAIQERDVANQALLALPELAYMGINISGTRAEVQVKEADQKPELLDESTPADVVAAADGIIVDIQAASGRAMFADGDIVAKGEVLIAGSIDLREAEGVTVDRGRLVVRAVGTVTARTWRTLKETIPLTTGVKEYTGESQNQYTLRLLWLRLDFFQNSSISYDRYDKITNTEYLTLFDHTLPFGLTTTTLREYTLGEAALDEAETAACLEQALLSRLEELMEANDGEVLRTDMVTQLDGGLLTVTLLAECQEEIGRTVEWDGEIGRVYGDGSQNTKDTEE